MDQIGRVLIKKSNTDPVVLTWIGLDTDPVDQIGSSLIISFISEDQTEDEEEVKVLQA